MNKFIFALSVLSASCTAFANSDLLATTTVECLKPAAAPVGEFARDHAMEFPILAVNPAVVAPHLTYVTLTAAMEGYERHQKCVLIHETIAKLKDHMATYPHMKMVTHTFKKVELSPEAKARLAEAIDKAHAAQAE